ncbi:FkbM family methyltransferase [Microbulbifer spongiae]|uniref:FkbM family methyltransferase n=1 Tax=Microbulbifer spongiae TaxID=2944933 RepID=A0ABY9EFZ7_9GAMM|nr:FkbM family methyltransferase [Microbulbifer sp. MI-G]WKD51445.1 FkbM family methyltransferase [Microbulbifer sp. MI-G]
MSYFKEIVVDNSKYGIFLPNKDTDYIQKKIFTEGLPYELEMLRGMASYMSPGDLVLDVGANVGNHTLYLAKIAGCQVLSFEPNESLCNAINNSLVYNKLNSKVVVHCVGVGSKPGKAHFKQFDENNLGGQSLVIGNELEDSIQVIRLDGLDLDQHISAIKVDVEGMELEVLEGAVEIIKRDLPNLYIECQTEQKFNEIHTWLSQYGYIYWHTYNATPTHLFLKATSVNIKDISDHLVKNVSYSEYYLKKQIKDLKFSLNKANEKYRGATKNIQLLKEKSKKNITSKKIRDKEHRLMEDMLEMLQNEISGFSEQLKLKNEEISQLDRCFSLAQKEKDQLDERLRLIQEDKFRLDTRLRLVEEERSWLYSQLKLVEEEKSRLDSEINLVQTEKLKLDAQLKLVQEERDIFNTRLGLLKKQKKQLAEGNVALAARLNTANLKYRTVTSQFLEIRQTRSFRFALYFSRLGKLMKRVVWSPIRLFRKLLQFVQQCGTCKSSQFETKRRNDDGPPSPKPASSKAINNLIEGQVKKQRIACIMDEFTYSSYSPECDLYALTPDAWQTELEDCKPQILFVESAWRGKDGLWGNKVGHTSQEVKGIVRWCQEQKIPTVFWNKEDPVHFGTFLNTARIFDFVFTTDIDCISRYKSILCHGKVYYLPFACQPKIHNPIEQFNRKDAFCFAGSYYAHYPERMRDLSNFSKYLTKYKPLEIYDRNHGEDHPDYKFPSIFDPYIIGSLPFEKINMAYKGYRYAINLNSIKQSQTMFARRVYELLASNTITVSNYSRGIRLMLGNLVITGDDGVELVQRIESLVSCDLAWRKFRLAGLRKVMLEHTYQDRLAYVTAKVNEEPLPNILPSVLVVGYANDDKQLYCLVTQFKTQNYSNKQLIVVVSQHVQVSNLVPNTSIEIIPIVDAKKSKLADYTGKFAWLAGMAADDYYGHNYLTDLVLSTRYSDADAIGKYAHYAWGRLGLKPSNLEAEYKLVNSIPFRAAIIRSQCIVNMSLYKFARILQTNKTEKLTVFSSDRFNYCRSGMIESADQVTIANMVDDLPKLDAGVKLSQLLLKAESVAPEKRCADDAPVISGSEFASYFKQKSDKNYQSKVVGDNWRLESTLQDGKHDYLYAAKYITPCELGYHRKAKFYLDVALGLNIQMVLFFFDKEKKRVGAEIRQANRNHEVEIPKEVKFIRFSIRIYGNGAADIRGLVLGHRKTHPIEVMGRNKYLLLTNHYPSYDDLYRNGFVHSRVKAYKECGINVDVFRMRKDEQVSFHEFQDVDIVTGCQQALHTMLIAGDYEHILVHFLDVDMWDVLKSYIEHIKVTVWVHGSEIHPWYRRKSNFENLDQEKKGRELSELRMDFWRYLLKSMPSNLKLIFVSKIFSEQVMEDLGFRLPERQYAIVHNPIDTDLFKYLPKPTLQRKKILSIRPFTSKIYANDLCVKAIIILSKKPFFKDLEICIIGKGRLFEQTVQPLKKYSNVLLKQKFLTREEIAEIHKEYGIFLCASRMDTQGVSRDEAMSSGLVPVTNHIAAIPEFVSEEDGMLAPAEDAQALAESIALLVEDANRFERISANAAARVRKQSCKSLIIEQEIKQFINQQEMIDSVSMMK